MATGWGDFVKEDVLCQISVLPPLLKRATPSREGLGGIGEVGIPPASPQGNPCAEAPANGVLGV